MVAEDSTEDVGTRIGIGEPRILVAGCGGAGCNVVSQVYEKDLPGVETLAVNTDPGSLDRACADVRVLLAQGVAVDGDSLLAEYAAEASRDLLRSATAADIVFLVAGLGGATGTGAGPILADAARDAGAHVVGVAILPFAAEGRQAAVEAGLARLKSACDSVVILDNNCLEKLGTDLPLSEAFGFIDRVVLTIIQGVLEHLSAAVLTTVVEEIESVARHMQDAPEGIPIRVVAPVVEATADFAPVAFDSTGFIGFR